VSDTAPTRLSTLPEIESALWRELQRAAHDKHHEWRTPVLATIGGGGDDTLPDARTVVLREVQPEQKQLVIYSDDRAAKRRQLQAQPGAVLVLWSRRLSWQLRLRVQVEVHTEGLAATSRWALLRASPAARDYLAPLAPGAELPTPGGADVVPGEGATEQREHFAVLVATVQAVDWLELHRQGHRRAAFDARGARWLVP
jgi:pyridoxamine 5'-phosphate oxidase